MAKNINKKAYTKETLLKLDIFRECFREWFPVFLHSRFISKIFIYDLFAGSGSDSEGTFGSPLILLEEARGDKRQYCEYFRSSEQKIAFAFNELQKRKAKTLESKVNDFFESCKLNCQIGNCPFENSRYFKHEDFQDIFQSETFNNILANSNYGKFILIDQYGFKQVDDDVFKKLSNSPKTDFIFFITSSTIHRFEESDVVKKYLKDKKVAFDEGKTKECHRIMANYFKSLIPNSKEYYLHHFTIQNQSNYYGLIFGSNHSFGMEKFLKVCWKYDPLAGESNCNTFNDFEPGMMFYTTDETNKKEEIRNLLKTEILSGKIADNISGLKFVLNKGGQTTIYLDVIDILIKAKRITIVGKKNRQITGIHNIDEYNIKITAK